MFDTTSFKRIIDTFYKQLLETKAEITDIKPAADKWSLKEIVGHLIDSASNNHQRFVRLQSDDLLGFSAYDGEKWVEVQKCNRISWDALVALWYNYNILLLNIIETADQAIYGNVWVKGEEAIPFEKLVGDYYKHIELHIDHFNKRMAEVNVNF